MTNPRATDPGDLRPSDVEQLGFSEVVSLLDEPNQPSGGVATIRRVLELVRLPPDARILEIGSNTGFTSIELASWTRGEVVGIDLLERSNELARAAAAEAGVRNAGFLSADATSIPFADESFDLIWASNVTSFIHEREQAISEYLRVTRRFGFVVLVPIYYFAEPPPALKQEVERALGAPLRSTGHDYWKEMFRDADAELLHREAFRYLSRSKADIDAYLRMVMETRRIAAVAPAVREALAERLRYFYELFDRNLQYCEFSILIFRKGRAARAPTLFVARPV